MSIRSKVLASLFLVLGLFLLATGWLAKGGAETFQAELLRHVRAELLEQGALDFAATARLFCDFYTTLPEELRAATPAAIPAPSTGNPESSQYLFFDGAGTPAPGISIDPRFEALVAQDLVKAFYDKALRGESSELTIDNYQAYLEGSAPLPAVVHLRAITEENLIVGMGGVQELADIRILSLTDTGVALVTRLARRSTGTFVLLVLMALTLAGLLLHVMFFRRLANTFRFAGIGTARAGLSWAELEDYTSRLRDVSDEKETIRVKLEHEIETRFQAEEERDRLKYQMEHTLGKFEAGIRDQYAEQLREAQAALMRREARALKRHLYEPLARTREAAAENGAGPEILDSLDRCLDTVRGLADDSGDLPHHPRLVALQPWLEGVARKFEQEHGTSVQTNIQNGAQVHIDPSALEKALEYVLENALHAAPEGTPVTLDALPVDRAVEIRIVDRGEGIDGAARPHILLPFFTLDESSDGLGLAITRAVIRRHGGKLAIQSETGKGTAIVVTLPLAES